MEFSLGYTLSRLSPEEMGGALLSHNLAHVREGAWMGVGQSGEVSLIKKLYALRKTSDEVWFRYAAYRAIDLLLINIEAAGDEAELREPENALNELRVSEGKTLHPAVESRIEWTIARLTERAEKSSKRLKTVQ